MILQFVVSVVTAFVFGYIAPYLFYGTEAVGPRYSFCTFLLH
jgi:hypothetical protein